MPSMSAFIGRVEELSKVELDSEAIRLVRVTQVQTAQLIAHLAEIDRRDVALELGYPGLFAYCTDRLGMSEPQAGLRLQVARVCRAFPAVLDSLAANRMSLTVAGRIAPHLKESNVDEVISDCEGMTKRQVVEYVTRFKPKPLVRSGIHRAPQSAGQSGSSLDSSDDTAAESSMGSRLTDAEQPLPVATSTVEPAPTPKPDPVRIEPARPGWSSLRFPASQELVDKIERLGEVLSIDAMRRLEDLVEVAVDLALEKKDPQQRHERRLKRQAKKQREAAAKSEAKPSSAEEPIHVASTQPEGSEPRCPDKAAEDAAVESVTRHIPDEIGDFVLDRAGYRCEFVGPDGTRCRSRTRLERDHIRPLAKAGHSPDGPHDASNLRCLCQRHNLWYARRHYGDAFIQQKIAAN